MDILCALWNAPKRGTRTLDLEGWAGEVGRPSAEVSLYLLEIKSKGVGNISMEDYQKITIISRRIVRDERIRKMAAKRKQKQRHNTVSRNKHADVTGIYHNSEVISHSSEEEKRKKREEEEKEKKKSSAGGQHGRSVTTWEAYRESYHLRYKVDPVRNHKTNSMLCQLVDKLGELEAPKVAAFYLTHNKPIYVNRRHPPDLLSLDAEGLRTEWATGTKVTTRELRSVEQPDNATEQLKRVLHLTKKQEPANVH